MYSVYCLRNVETDIKNVIFTIINCDRYEVKEVDYLIAKYRISFYNNDGVASQYIGDCYCDDYEVKEEN